MNYFENIFICYSPVHITAAFSLSNKKSLVILPRKYESTLKFLQTKNVQVKYAYIFTFTDKTFIKIFALVYNLIISRKFKYNCKNLFIPNAAHHGIRVISKYIKFEYLNYFDEGSTVLSLIREKKISFKSNQLSKFCLGLFGIKVGDNFLDEKFQNHYVFYPNILRELGSFKNVKRIPPVKLNPRAKKLLKESIFLNHNRESILFLTSPLTENKWVEYNNQEIFLINQFLNVVRSNLSNYSIYFKPHYREKISKYEEFLKQEYFYLLPKNIPSQVLSSILNPKLVVGFHSSALFEYQSPQQIISLSKLINTPQCISLSNGLKVYQDYFKELNLLENFEEVVEFI